MRKHWSEVLSCRCGKTFQSAVDEARHRHNFPMLCKGVKTRNVVLPLQRLAAIDAQSAARDDARNSSITLPKSARE